jgi:hypothetical protein
MSNTPGTYLPGMSKNLVLSYFSEHPLDIAAAHPKPLFLFFYVAPRYTSAVPVWIHTKEKIKKGEEI